MKTADYGRLLAHPTRVRIVSLIGEEKRSPASLARELEMPLGNVSYHIQALVKMGALRQAGKRVKGGTFEHFYSLRPEVGERLSRVLATVSV
jgi:DNA-binding transcriptional ArsR family regulator